MTFKVDGYYLVIEDLGITSGISPSIRGILIISDWSESGRAAIIGSNSA